MATVSIKNTHPFFEMYDRFIKDSKSGRRLQPNGKKITEGTISNYRYTKLLLQKFCAEKSFDLRISNVRKLTQREIKAEKNYWLKFYKKFTDYLYIDCGHFDNYVGANIKNIRTFFGYLNKDLLLQTGDFYKQFYVLIYDKAFEESLPALLKKVKDVFVFGCTVALRFSDLMALKKTSIRVSGNNWYLLVRSASVVGITLARKGETKLNNNKRSSLKWQ
jgi:hypothetical protein